MICKTVKTLSVERAGASARDVTMTSLVASLSSVERGQSRSGRVPSYECGRMFPVYFASGHPSARDDPDVPVPRRPGSIVNTSTERLFSFRMSRRIMRRSLEHLDRLLECGYSRDKFTYDLEVGWLRRLVSSSDPTTLAWTKILPITTLSLRGDARRSVVDKAVGREPSAASDRHTTRRRASLTLRSTSRVS